MNVRVMWVRVDEFLVTMRVRVRFTGRVVRAVGVLVMLVVCVQVLVFHRLVTVFVPVMFRQVQPDAERHEHCGSNETNRQSVPQE